MWWVKSSQRRNSTRVNRFQQKTRARGKKWGLAQNECGLDGKTWPFSLTVCPSLLLCSSLSVSLSNSFVPPSLFRLILPPSLHSPASSSGIDLWLHALCFLLWNWLDMYVILCNYKSVTSIVCDPNVLNKASSCVLVGQMNIRLGTGCCQALNLTITPSIFKILYFPLCLHSIYCMIALQYIVLNYRYRRPIVYD